MLPTLEGSTAGGLAQLALPISSDWGGMSPGEGGFLAGLVRPHSCPGHAASLLQLLVVLLPLPPSPQLWLLLLLGPAWFLAVTCGAPGRGGGGGQCAACTWAENSFVLGEITPPPKVLFKHCKIFMPSPGVQQA